MYDLTGMFQVILAVVFGFVVLKKSSVILRSKNRISVKVGPWVPFPTYFTYNSGSVELEEGKRLKA